MCTFHSFLMPTCSNFTNFYPCPFISIMANVSIMPDIGQYNLLVIGHSKSFETISSTNLYSCLHLGDTFFCKGRKVRETRLQKSCLVSLYLSNAEEILSTCKFKVTKASEKIFEHLGRLLNWHDPHKPGMLGKEYNPDPTDQIRQHCLD